MSSPTVLIVYHTTEGQTAKIADRIGAVLEAADVTVDVFGANGAPPPTGYDGVILGDSIHLTQHSQSLTRYAKTHIDELHTMPLALFQVSLTSATKDEEHSTKAHQLLADFVDETGIDPDLVGLFAGSLAYTKYGWFKRRLLREIVFADIGETDISSDHEYTDWEAVEEFATDVAALLTQARPDN